MNLRDWIKTGCTAIVLGGLLAPPAAIAAPTAVVSSVETGSIDTSQAPFGEEASSTVASIQKASVSSLAVAGSYFYPRAKKVSPKCEDSRKWFRDRIELGQWTPGKKGVIKASGCMKGRKQDQRIDLEKLKVKRSKAARSMFKRDARVILKLGDRHGQNVTWKATVNTTSWAQVKLPVVKCYIEDQCVLEIWVSLKKRTAGKWRRVLYNWGGVNNGYHAPSFA